MGGIPLGGSGGRCKRWTCRWWWVELAWLFVNLNVCKATIIQRPCRQISEDSYVRCKVPAHLVGWQTIRIPTAAIILPWRWQNRRAFADTKRTLNADKVMNNPLLPQHELVECVQHIPRFHRSSTFKRKRVRRHPFSEPVPSRHVLATLSSLSTFSNITDWKTGRSGQPHTIP